MQAAVTMRTMRSIVILISGRGSNMEAIVRAAQAEKWPVSLAAVISNRPDVAGLAFARQPWYPDCRCCQQGLRYA